MSGLRGTVLGAYRTPAGDERQLRCLDAGAPASRLVPEVLAARLQTRGGLVLDVRPGGGDERVLARLEAGEGLLAAEAVIADYRPRAERADRPLARRLDAEDLLALGDQEAA